MQPTGTSRVLRAAVYAITTLSVSVASGASGGATNWTSSGYDTQNTRFSKAEKVGYENKKRR